MPLFTHTLCFCSEQRIKFKSNNRLNKINTHKINVYACYAVKFFNNKQGFIIEKNLNFKLGGTRPVRRCWIRIISRIPILVRVFNVYRMYRRGSRNFSKGRGVRRKILNEKCLLIHVSTREHIKTRQTCNSFSLHHLQRIFIYFFFCFLLLLSFIFEI